MPRQTSLRSQVLRNENSFSLGFWPDLIIILALIITGFQINSWLLPAIAFFVFSSKNWTFNKPRVVYGLFLVINIIFGTSIVYLNLFPLQIPFEQIEKIGLLVSLALIIIFKLVILLKFENQKFGIDLIKQNIIWVISFLVSIIIFFTTLDYLDFTLAFSIACFLVYTTFLNISKNFGQQENSIENQETPQDLVKIKELEEKIIQDILRVDKLEKIYDIKIVQDSVETLVIGNLIVSNTCSQEEIFEIKSKVKKILSEENFEDSILEVKYLVEFEKNIN
jgi:hypothetical protein